PQTGTSLLGDWDFENSTTVPSNMWIASGLGSGAGQVSVVSPGDATQGTKYAVLHGGTGLPGSGAYLYQYFPIITTQPLYYAVALRGHGSGSILLLCQFEDKNHAGLGGT